MLEEEKEALELVGLVDGDRAALDLVAGPPLPRAALGDGGDVAPLARGGAAVDARQEAQVGPHGHVQQHAVARTERRNR
ncbi:MAG: hypothetical protein ACK56I_14290, partial [bacterium]